MNIRLTITQRDQPGTTQEPRTESFDADTILLGRDKSCDVVLSSTTVSRAHARIIQDGGLCYLEDTGSSFGTQVNNEPLPQGEKRRLYPGDIIAIAQFDVLFEAVAQMDTGTHARPVEAPKSSRKRPSIILAEKPYLRIMNGPNQDTRIELEEGHEYIVGRTQEAQILLNTDLVSRKHAKLRRDLGGTHVEDLGSRNGIRLNRKPIASATLSDGDELEIGGIKMLYIDLNEMKDNPLSFDKIKTTPPPPKPTKPPAPQTTPPAAPPSAPPAPPKQAAKPAAPKPSPEPEKRKPEEAPKEAPPKEEEAPQEEDDNLGLPSDTPEKPPPQPLLQGKQAIVLLAIGGSAALLALILLILLIVGF